MLNPLAEAVYLKNKKSRISIFRFSFVVLVSVAHMVFCISESESYWCLSLSFSNDTFHDVCGGAESPYHGKHHRTLSKDLT